MNELSLTEIVTNLREEADGCERLHRAICAGGHDVPPPSVISTIRAAADRLEGLAKLAGSVTIDALDEMTVEHHESVDHWFAERDRLLK